MAWKMHALEGMNCLVRVVAGDGADDQELDFVAQPGAGLPQLTLEFRLIVEPPTR